MFVCHLCMNYNSALTEGEVSPSSWFDESVVRVCESVFVHSRSKRVRQREGKTTINRGHFFITSVLL